MIYRLVPSESAVSNPEFHLDNAVMIRVDKIEDVVFIKVPKTLTHDELVAIDKKCYAVFGHKKYIVLADTVNFVKLEEVKE